MAIALSSSFTYAGEDKIYSSSILNGTTKKSYFIDFTISIRGEGGGHSHDREVFGQVHVNSINSSEVDSEAWAKDKSHYDSTKSIEGSVDSITANDSNNDYITLSGVLNDSKPGGSEVICRLKPEIPFYQKDKGNPIKGVFTDNINCISVTITRFDKI